jgi:hypothetical protein
VLWDPLVELSSLCIYLNIDRLSIFKGFKTKVGFKLISFRIESRMSNPCFDFNRHATSDIITIIIIIIIGIGIAIAVIYFFLFVNELTIR